MIKHGEGNFNTTGNSRFTRRVRCFFIACCAVCIGLCAGILIVECVLRFLPVNESPEGSSVVDGESPIGVFKPNNEFVFSRGWDFALNNVVQTNNYGFVNGLQYDPSDDSPLLAVIGDSYVEAIMVPYKNTIHGRLAEKNENHGRVYSFGFSGAPLSQYLAYARYAKETFRPNSMVFVIVGNDFDESMTEYKNAPGFHYFFPNDDGTRRLELVEYHANHPSLVHKIGNILGLNKLAVVRYVRTNALLLENYIFNLFRGDEGQFVGQTSALVSERRVALSKEAVDCFFDKLPFYSGLAESKILFVVDGFRPQLYNEATLALVRGSYFDIMRQYFIQKARYLGYEVVNMQPLFVRDYRKNGKVFEYPTDGHWNDYGHRLAYEAVQKTSVVSETFLSIKNK